MDENQLGELVEKAKKGDHQAFEKLYSASSRQVYFTCISFLGNAEDAKDVMQDVYMTAYEKLSSLNDAEKFIPWINRIAINHCKKILMKKAVSFSEIESSEDEQTEENENFLPEQYITQKEKRKLVMDIMRNTLSDIQYKTVILYYFNGLSVEEVADLMECPPGTVKYRLSVARAKIKKGVDAYENKSGDKLYSVVGLPLLMRLLYEEADSIDVPDMLQTIMEALNTLPAAGQINSPGASSVTDAAPDHAADTPADTPANTTADAPVNTAANTPTNIPKGGIIKKMAMTPKTLIAAAVTGVVIIGGAAAAIIVTNQEGATSSDTQAGQESASIFDTQTGQEDQTAEEALESLNEEFNAIIEEEQREAEEQAQQLEEGYPEGVLPEGQYVCREVVNNDEYDLVVSAFWVGDVYLNYIYDDVTQEYIILYRGDLAFDHHWEGYLNDEGDFVVTYYARHDQKKLSDAVMADDTFEGTFEETAFRRYEEIYPEVVVEVHDDIEWVYEYWGTE